MVKKKSSPPDVSHKPTDEMRKKVQSYAAVGITQADICAILGITEKTLRKHYRQELDTAVAQANAQIGGKLYKAAMGGCKIRQIFWLKTRAKWSEKLELDNTHKFKDIDKILAEDRAILQRAGINLGSTDYGTATTDDTEDDRDD